MVDAGASSPLFIKAATLALFIWAVGFLIVSLRLVVRYRRDLHGYPAHSKPLLEEHWMRAVFGDF